MSRQNAGKIKKYRKTIDINLGTIFFGVIFFYIIVCVFIYITSKEVAGYQVKKGSLFVNNVYTGLAIREERVITGSYSGYLNYYVREGTRVGADKMVCTIDEGGRLQELIAEQNMGENALSDKALDELRDDIIEFTKDFNTQNFARTYDFKYTMEGNVLKQANSGILEDLEKLNRSGDSGLINVCKAPESGIVVYSYDGYEEVAPSEISSEILKNREISKTQLIANELVSSGDPVYKLVTDENWSLIIETDAERAEYLAEKEYVQVKFLKDQTVSWAEVNSFTNKEGSHMVQLMFNNSMITFCSERFVDIELLLDEEEGLKVPNSAIVEKDFFRVPKEYVSKQGENGELGVLKQVYDEDGNLRQEFIPVTVYSEDDKEYYIDSYRLELGDVLQKMDSNISTTIHDKGSLTGVYNKNKGYADFKQIQILYQNDEYAIVKSNTQYGLMEFDYIVLDAQLVSEDEILE